MGRRRDYDSDYRDVSFILFERVYYFFDAGLARCAVDLCHRHLHPEGIPVIPAEMELGRGFIGHRYRGGFLLPSRGCR
ncbi:hypothetical protein D1872_302270 [compost metagenome]